MPTIGPKRIATFIEPFKVKPGSKVRLGRDFDTGPNRKVQRDEAKRLLKAGVEMLAEYQSRLAAQDNEGLLVVLQAMDAAGKDGTIRHVMSGVNPQGVQVHSFKVPSSTDLDHDYLWRYAKKLPAHGDIGIFNRSYYEEVLVVRVHPSILDNQKLPKGSRKGDIWQRRFREINDWERYLSDQGFRIVKIFLNLGKEEQRARFLSRDRRAGEELEVLGQRCQGAGLLGRLSEGLLRGPVQHEHHLGSVVRRPGRRQAIRPGRRRCGHPQRPHRDRPALSPGEQGGARSAPGREDRPRGPGAEGCPPGSERVGGPGGRDA